MLCLCGYPFANDAILQPKQGAFVALFAPLCAPICMLLLLRLLSIVSESYVSLRSLAVGMFSCSRYLAAVRRAMGNPFAAIALAKASSLSGCCLSSLSTIVLKAKRI